MDSIGLDVHAKLLSRNGNQLLLVRVPVSPLTKPLVPNGDGEVAGGMLRA